MSQETRLLLDAALAVIVLVVLITRFRLHAFIALLLASGLLGILSGMPAGRIAGSFQKGVGDVLGFVAIVIGLGTMLGKMLAKSGGADRIALTLTARFSKERVHWAMMLVAFLAGIPLFFEIGFVLLVPLVFVVSRRAGVPLIKVGIALVAGLSVVHGLVPPHPGPVLAIQIFGADMGRTIVFGLLVGLPTAVIAGPIFGSVVSRWVPGRTSSELIDQFARESRPANLPGFGITLATVLLPVVLMLLKSCADVVLDPGSPARAWMDLLGHPITALLLALLLSLYTLGLRCGMDARGILKLLDQGLHPIAVIVLIIGAGGGFKEMLVASGVGDAIAHFAVGASVAPILLAWTVAAAIRIATGSATVATVTGAGIVAPVVAMVPGTSPELLVLATGAGSLMLSHVNDAGFWLVKEYFNMSIVETFKTWTLMETLVSVLGLVFTLILSTFVA